jgi:uncharacterized UPF0160 family protein
MQAQQLTGIMHISSVSAATNRNLAQQAFDDMCLATSLLQMLRHQIMKLPCKDDTRKQISAVESEILKIQQEITSHQHTYQVGASAGLRKAACVCAPDNEPSAVLALNLHVRAAQQAGAGLLVSC